MNWLTRLGATLARPTPRDQAVLDLAERMGQEVGELRRRLERAERAIEQLEQQEQERT